MDDGSDRHDRFCGVLVGADDRDEPVGVEVFVEPVAGLDSTLGSLTSPLKTSHDALGCRLLELLREVLESPFQESVKVIRPKWAISLRRQPMAF